MHRQIGQPSLAESLLPQTLGRNERLERIAGEFDWDRFASLLEDIYSSSEGRPSYPPLTMVKVLLLEQWYNLSDPQMEEALSDRISFRRFVGLGLEDDTPDHSTISRFRSELASRELSERLFNELESQLDKRGLMLKEGTLMDATLVEAQVRRPPRSAARGRIPKTRTRTGRIADEVVERTSDTRFMWEWTLVLGWFARRSLPRRRCMRARLPTSW